MISITYHTFEVSYMGNLKGKHVWTATVGEKGQIVIPKQARDIFGIKPVQEGRRLCYVHSAIIPS